MSKLQIRLIYSTLSIENLKLGGLEKFLVCPKDLVVEGKGTALRMVTRDERLYISLDVVNGHRTQENSAVINQANALNLLAMYNITYDNRVFRLGSVVPLSQSASGFRGDVRDLTFPHDLLVSTHNPRAVGGFTNSTETYRNTVQADEDIDARFRPRSSRGDAPFDAIPPTPWSFDLTIMGRPVPRALAPVSPTLHVDQPQEDHDDSSLDRKTLGLERDQPGTELRKATVEPETKEMKYEQQHVNREDYLIDAAAEAFAEFKHQSHNNVDKLFACEDSDFLKVADKITKEGAYDLTDLTYVPGGTYLLSTYGEPFAVVKLRRYRTRLTVTVELSTAPNGRKDPAFLKSFLKFVTKSTAIHDALVKEIKG